ncbi:MAG TPA: ABC transporter permease [Nitrolancea sp.]|nr:ABC transporter permease [Nitrolancea sp.]
MSEQTALKGSSVDRGGRLRGGPEPYWRWVVKRIIRVRLAPLSLAIVVLSVLMALFAGQLAPDSPTKSQLTQVLERPSSTHVMGTDDLGRDVLSRIIFGSRASLSAGVVSTGIGLALGTFLGLISGYFLGIADTVIMRVMDALLAFPGLILALAITAALGPSLINAMIAIGIVSVPRFARLARGQVLSLRQTEYVEAVRALGAGNNRILFRHIGPNMLTPIIVQASLSVAFAILTEASLSVLGLGVQPPTPSWGFMLNQGRDYLGQAPWLAIFPGIAIFLVVMAFNLLGDAIRDALDPRLRL